MIDAGFGVLACVQRLLVLLGLSLLALGMSHTGVIARRLINRRLVWTMISRRCISLASVAVH